MARCISSCVITDHNDFYFPDLKRSNALNVLQEKLGYVFRNRMLLERALTHRSVAKNADHNYEPLETLGDSLISAMICKTTFSSLASPTPRDMTRLRSHASNNETLALIGKKLEIESCLKCSEDNIRKTGGIDSVVADCVEAIFGAMWLDCGDDLSAVYSAFNSLFGQLLTEPPSRCVDAKTRLQLYCQKKYKSPPVYSMESSTGPAHAKNFVTKVVHDNNTLINCYGSGPSKKRSENEAAQNALFKIGSDPLLSRSPAGSRRVFKSKFQIQESNNKASEALLPASNNCSSAGLPDQARCDSLRLRGEQFVRQDSLSSSPPGVAY